MKKIAMIGVMIMVLFGGLGLSFAADPSNIEGVWDVVYAAQDGSVAHMTWEIVQHGSHDVVILMDDYGVAVKRMRYYGNIIWCDNWMGFVGWGATSIRGYHIVPKFDGTNQPQLLHWSAVRRVEDED